MADINVEFSTPEIDINLSGGFTIDSTARELAQNASDRADDAEAAATAAAASAANAEADAAEAAELSSKTAANLASEYSASSTHEVGDYVLYNSVLYECTTAITTAEEWTAAHWQAVKVGDEVENLQSAISYHEEKINSLHNLVNYDYGTKRTIYPPTASTRTSVDRFRTQIKLSYDGQGTNPKRVKLNGTLERFNGSSYQSAARTLQLEEGAKYQVVCKKISGSAVYETETEHIPAIVVYEEDNVSSIAKLSLYDNDKRVYTFTGAASKVNIMIYIYQTSVLTDLLLDVSLYKITDEDESEEDESIKAYFVDEMEDTIEKARNEIDSPAIVFPVVTDIHRYVAAVQTFDSMIENMSYFIKQVKCDFIINMGDTIEGDQPLETSLEYGYDCTKSFANIGLPYFNVNGNHDDNKYTDEAGDRFTSEQLYKVFFAANRGQTPWLAYNGTDYYFDYNELKTRIIVIDSAKNISGSTYHCGAGTGTWLASEALKEGYTNIVITHVSPIPAQVYQNKDANKTSGVAEALTAFVNGGGQLIMLSGHSHHDFAFVLPWLSIMQECQRFTDTEGYVITPDSENPSQITGFIDNIVKPRRTAETYTEDSWSVCVYKPLKAEIALIRFGAGADRYFHTTPIEPQTVTSKLAEVTWSSSDTSVATVSNGVITGVSTGRCAVIAKDANGNFECWTVDVA